MNTFDAYMEAVGSPMPGQKRASNLMVAFAALRFAKLALYQASEKAISAKAALDKKRSELLATDGAITGPNKEAREAKVDQLCWLEMAALEVAEAEKRKAAHEADQAGLVVTEIQWLIRNDEATAALVRERIL